MKRAILYIAWGESYLNQVSRAVAESALPAYPIFLFTDMTTPIGALDPTIEVMRVPFRLHGKLRKCEIVDHLPSDFDSLVLLDSDTRVLADITLGFAKAETWGMAMAQAAHYSLDQFQEFAQVLEKEGVEPRGQLLYNSGVVFFSSRPDVLGVLDLWKQLCTRYRHARWSDQPHLTLAIELLGFNPYTLTTGYNHRAFGELVSGSIRIWHSTHAVPDNVDDLQPAFPRRFENGRIVPVEIFEPKPQPSSKE